LPVVEKLAPKKSMDGSESSLDSIMEEYRYMVREEQEEKQIVN
jgi:hypothetical protein